MRKKPSVGSRYCRASRCGNIDASEVPRDTLRTTFDDQDRWLVRIGRLLRDARANLVYGWIVGRLDKVDGNRRLHDLAFAKHYRARSISDAR